MIRFEIEGHRVELNESTRLQLKKTNMLFDFDNVQCERSTEFDIPATPNNQAIFEIASDEHAKPLTAYASRSATMTLGLVCLTGYAYISDYDARKRNYKCVFMTGELQKLLAVKNAGNLAEYLSLSDVVTYGDTESAATYKTQLFRPHRYRHSNDEEPIHPSIRAVSLMNAAATYLGIGVPTLISLSPAYYARFMNRQIAGLGAFVGSIKTTDTQSLGNLNTLDVAAFNVAPIVQPKTGHLIRRLAGGPDTQFTINEYEALVAMRLTIASDAPSNLAIISADDTYSYSGTPLIMPPIAGQSVDIARGETFIVVDMDYYSEPTTPTSQAGYWNDRAFRASVSVSVEGVEGTAQVGDVVRAQDNIPEMTFVDLLKILAALNGSLLYYNALSDSFEFVSLPTTPSSVFDITDRVIDIASVKRTALSYAKHNLIEFATSAYVPRSQRIIVDYVVKNDNISDENQLLEIAFNEGSRTEAGEFYFDDESGEDSIFANPSSGFGTYMTRVSPTKDAALQSVLTRPVSIVVNARMTLQEFQSISPMTAILCRSARYFWTSSTWQNDVAEFELLQF